MILRIDGWYNADKGKHFVLTEKGEKNSASYKGKTIGEPVSEYDTEAVRWAVEKGYLEEVAIPDWIIKDGYRVVYNHNGHILTAGNPVIFPELEIAEKYMENYKKHPWFEHKLYIEKAVFEGRALKERRVYANKPICNKDWYYGTDALQIGDLVEDEIVNELLNCLPPACMRSDCSQLGEPANHRVDEKDGKLKPTYSTFKEISVGIWEYCGDCFRGENYMHGIHEE